MSEQLDGIEAGRLAPGQPMINDTEPTAVGGAEARAHSDADQSPYMIEDAAPDELAALGAHRIEPAALAAAMIQAEALIGTIADAAPAPVSSQRAGDLDADALVEGLRTAIAETTGALRDGKVTYL